MASITDPEPYTKDDMFRESSEGRSLHDDCRTFYRTIMKLPVPLVSENQPSVDQICDAIGKVKRDDLLTWSFVYSLFLTEKSALWPDTDECHHSMGMMWKACKSYSGAALSYIHACNVDVQKSRSIVSKKRRVLPTKNSSTSKKPKSVSPSLAREKTVIESSSTSPNKSKKIGKKTGV